MLTIVAPTDADYQARLTALARRTSALPETIETGARAIVDDVRQRGDAAVRELTERFEKRALTSLELPRAEWDAAVRGVDAAVLRALERAAARISAFAERERASSAKSFEWEDNGVRLGSRVAPLERVGIYVPGGTARYPSTVLMTACPARVAGVGEIIMVTPGPSPETLAAARVAGVDRVFVIGGAQAVAALAYGTESVPRVDKIVGPGNAWVTAAKRIVYGDVGIDSIAGPTEVVVAADASANPAWVAADLLAQAEHDVLSAAVLVAVGRDVADAVNVALTSQLAVLPRRAIAEESVRRHGLAIVVATAAEAVAVVNSMAAEHAELMLENARALAPSVTTAGAVFVGAHTPEPVGDYFAGPSHVLPTGGSARFASPLGVGDFLKRTSVLEYDAAALADQAADIERLAAVEDLEGHGRAVAARRLFT